MPNFNSVLSPPPAPDDLSLKVYRAEANWAMMQYSDALTDLDYLCCLRPNWTEVRNGALS